MLKHRYSVEMVELVLNRDGQKPFVLSLESYPSRVSR
jgi:hypothetical protein